MANGDAAAAAGMDIVLETDDRRRGYDEINKTRDYIAEQIAEWIPYVATLGAAVGTFSVGAGTAKTEYKRIGGRICVHYEFILGSGFSMGTGPTFSLPMSVIKSVPRYTWLTGRGSAYDVSTGNAPPEVATRLDDFANDRVAMSTYTGTVANITGSAPFAWAAGDIIAGEIWADPA